MANSTKRNDGRRRAIIYVITALVVLSTLAVMGIYAKYTTGKKTEGYVSAAEFYFTSDILKETPATYTLNPGKNGETEISFELRNYADALRWSDGSIEFKIGIVSTTSEALEGVTMKVDKIPQEINSDSSHGTLEGGSAQSAKVTISGLKNGTTYTVTATGDAGYVSTLSAIIVVKPDENNIYYNVASDHEGHYILLTVWTEKITGTVNITFPDGLIPDGTDPVMYKKDFSEKKVVDEINFKDKTYSSHVYRFFVTGNINQYTNESFKDKITISDAITAQASTLK